MCPTTNHLHARWCRRSPPRGDEHLTLIRRSYGGFEAANLDLGYPPTKPGCGTPSSPRVEGRAVKRSLLMVPFLPTCLSASRTFVAAQPGASSPPFEGLTQVPVFDN